MTRRRLPRCGVPMGMIFVRNENGSHNPHEAMEIDDFMAGVSLLTWYLSQQFARLLAH